MLGFGAFTLARVRFLLCLGGLKVRVVQAEEFEH